MLGRFDCLHQGLQIGLRYAGIKVAQVQSFIQMNGKIDPIPLSSLHQPLYIPLLILRQIHVQFHKIEPQLSAQSR